MTTIQARAGQTAKRHGMLPATGGHVHRFALVVMAAGCSEYGLGGGLFGGRNRDEPVEAPKEGDPNAGDPSKPGQEEPFPGEDRPEDWPEWDASCGRWGSGPGGGAGVDTYVIDEEIEALTVMLSVGDLDIIPRDGPVEVELSGVTLNGAQGPHMDGRTLVLNYIDSVGDLTVWAPPDLLRYDLRVCVGDLQFSELSGEVAAEVRTGNIDGLALRSPLGFIHNRTGDASVHFDAAPAQLWMEGQTGSSLAELPSSTCDCEIDVGVGVARLVDIEQDPASGVAVRSERQVGDVVVQGDR